MADKKVKATEPVETTTEWTIEDIKAVEVQIGTDLANAGHLLILGVTAEFYRVTGEKTGAAWLSRMLAGTGFTFSRAKRTDGELCARDQAIVALLQDGATLTTIADTLGIGVATAHKVMREQGQKSAGGEKTGAGRVATTTPATTDAPTNDAPTTTTTTTTVKQSWLSEPVSAAMRLVDKIGAAEDPEQAADGWAILFAYVLEKSGYDADTLAARAAALAEAGKEITAA